MAHNMDGLQFPISHNYIFENSPNVCTEYGMNWCFWTLDMVYILHSMRMESSFKHSSTHSMMCATRRDNFNYTICLNQLLPNQISIILLNNWFMLLWHHVDIFSWIVKCCFEAFPNYSTTATSTTTTTFIYATKEPKAFAYCTKYDNSI